jgi:hypothetical protein
MTGYVLITQRNGRPVEFDRADTWASARSKCQEASKYWGIVVQVEDAERWPETGESGTTCSINDRL